MNVDDEQRQLTALLERVAEKMELSLVAYREEFDLQLKWIEDLNASSAAMRTLLAEVVRHLSPNAIADIRQRTEARLTFVSEEAAERYLLFLRPILGYDLKKPVSTKIDRREFGNWIKDFPVPFSDRFKAAHVRTD
jgi:hypothetical protein